MAKSLLDIFLKSIFDEEWIGKHGEKLTERELKFVKMFGRKGKILRNVYLPKDNGETSEIDVMYITQKGIFVFESKNYSGWIFGDEKSQYWTAMLPNRQKNKFYNPIKQNRTHIKWLQNYLGTNVPLFSIIVFSERCELKKVEIESADVKVIKRDKTYAVVKDLWDSHEDAVEEVDVLFEKLSKLTNVDESVKMAHIANIEKKYKQPKSDYKLKESLNVGEEEWHDNEFNSLNSDEKCKSVDLNESTKNFKESLLENNDIAGKEKFICPKCGKELVLRTAKKGSNCGNQFYGCSGFPKCRYIKEI